MASLKVFYHHPLEEAFVQRFQQGLSPAIQLRYGTEVPAPPDYQLIVSGRPTREMIEGAPQLQTLIIPWAGVPVTTRELMAEFPHIAVHNLHHNAAPTAETALALLFAAAKSLVELDRTLRRNDWSPRYEKTTALLLEGKTAVVLGAGAIGRRVTRVCLAAGMQVVAVNRSKKDFDPPVISDTIDHLSELLPRADALIVCVPLTPETTDLLTARELALLPDQAIVVNISRGQVINEEALFRELQTGRIRAGIDVWYLYPAETGSRTDTAPSRFPFHELPNVVMTPHNGGHSDGSEALRIRELQRLLNLAATGQPLPNRVDIARGY